MQTVQEIYQQNVVALPENEQIKLAALILEQVTRRMNASTAKQTASSVTNSGEILDEDFESTRRELVKQFNESIEKTGREINL